LSSFELAFNEISLLVNNFKENEKYYLSNDYQEADVRNDFINKFFIALGWDVRHEHQINPYEQEVRVERPVQIAKAQKRADYSFSLSPNYRIIKFFVEAKKPVHGLDNKDFYFQTSRYGWNASTPIAVLTDFEEFHIIDCRFRPTIDDALNYKIKKFRYSDYTDKEKFGEIYWLFSREAVAKNSIEKYEAELPKPRGKSVQRGLFKGGYQSIDEAFLEELDEIRNDLAKSFKKNNSHLSSEELTEATQRTIDRLVFIKFLEDKLIEPDHYVSEFGGRKNAWEDFLIDSRKLNAKYNGVVFKKSIIDSKSIIEPDDKTFSNICEELSHENTPYNFDAIPIHILGSIYERFLGKVVNATDKRVTIEEKPEVRKAGGVYYTPQYIVNYIVDNTVGKLIAGKTPKEIAKLRFADIACGSGSFLITVFEHLLDYHKRWYIENPEQAKKDGCILVEGNYRLSLKQKTKILLNNVYGADIDQQAVEVTQLSLYLKLLEDETTATANDSWVMFKEQLLPDLNKNIVCGNSLVGTDILIQQTSLAFGETEEGVNELKLKPMDFETVFPEIIKAGGFDAIVGNPPYDVLEKDRLKETIPHLALQDYININSSYRSALGGKLNLYRFFLVKSIQLTKNNGRYGLIVPSSILADKSCSITRAFVINNTCNLEFDCFPQKDNPNKRIFKDAKLSTTILFGKKNNVIDKTKEAITVRTYPANLFSDSPKTCLIRYEDLRMIDPENLPIPLTDNKNWRVVIKVHSSPRITNLGFFFNDFIVRRGEINQTIFKKFIQSEETNAIRLIKGVQIGPYKFNLKLSQGTVEWFNEKKFLQKNNYREIVDYIRIATQRITGVDERLRIVATIIEPRAYFADSTNSIHKLESSQYDLKYLLALLNSKIFQWRFKLTSTNNNVGTNELNAMPIRVIDFQNVQEKKIHDELTKLVDQLLTAKKKLQHAKTEGDKNYLQRKCETLDKEIDQLVYGLYGLTEEEINIVEGNEE
jgi:adenine-specific DNA-methyltransferase